MEEYMCILNLYKDLSGHNRCDVKSTVDGEIIKGIRFESLVRIALYRLMPDEEIEIEW